MIYNCFGRRQPGSQAEAPLGTQFPPELQKLGEEMWPASRVGRPERGLLERGEGQSWGDERNVLRQPEAQLTV